MKLRILRWRSQLLLVIFLVLAAGSLSFAAAQEKPQSKPINLDRELEVKVPQNRALSYYHYSLAKWHEENGDTASALLEMRKAVKYNESSSAAHIGLASLLLDKVGDAQEAMSEATEAARLDPTDPEPHWILANIDFKSQELEKAVKELEAMRDVAPQDERAYFALGTAYLELGQTDKGIKAFERFQTLVPNTNQGYIEIAHFYQRKAEHEQGADQAKYLEKSLEFLKKAVEIDPDSVQTLVSLADLQAKLNKTQDLIATYKKILELTGDNPNIKKQLAGTLIDSGQFSEALKIGRAHV
jgi:tetratricopeptide (TPR) repeat protein